MRRLRNIIVFIFCVFFAFAHAEVPQWWVDRGVATSADAEKTEEAINSNYDTANVGQLMFIASRAAEELNAKVEGGAGKVIESLVNSFPKYDANNPDANYHLVNIGQVKYVAKPFYDRLWDIEKSSAGSVNFPTGMVFLSGGSDSSTHKYPWNALPENPTNSDYNENYEIANIGQIKNLFSWSLNEEFLIMPDRNGDGIPDIFDTQWSENIESLRYLSILPIGGSIKIAHDGDVVFFTVKVVDETGRKISNAPLKILAGGVETTDGCSTDANGVFTFSHTASFADVSENQVCVALSSEKPHSRATFLIKKAVDSEISEQSNILSQWATDNDPSKSEERHYSMPPFSSLANVYTSGGFNYFYKDGSLEYHNPIDGNLHKDGLAMPSYSKYTGDFDGEHVEINESILKDIQLNKIPLPIDTGKVRPETILSTGDIASRLSFIQNATVVYTGTDGKMLDDYSYVHVFYPNNFENVEGLSAETNEKIRDIIARSFDDSGAYLGCAANKFSEQVILNYIKLPWAYGYPLENYNGLGANYIANINSRSLYFDGFVYPFLKDDCDAYGKVSYKMSVSNKSGNKIILKRYFYDGGIDMVNGSEEYKTVYKHADYRHSFPFKLEFIPENDLEIAQAEVAITYKYHFPENFGQFHNQNGLDVTIGVDKFLVTLSPSGDSENYSMPMSESAGPKYRKISLGGRPISDDKPQMEEEEDKEPFETYIDALSLGLRHDVADISLKVPASDLTLDVRRSYQPLSWNFKSGLRPHERPEFAFGGNWSTNLVSYICIQRQNVKERTSPDTALVVDENGASFSYCIKNGNEFYPEPSGYNNQQAYQCELSDFDFELDFDDGDDYLTFTKKYGTTLSFEAVGFLGTVADRIHGGDDTIAYKYYRLSSVSDRYGNKIIYEYPDSFDEEGNSVPTLIPSRVYVEGRDDIAIYITQENGKITSVRDPSGRVVSYEYNASSSVQNVSNSAIPLLPPSVNSQVSADRLVSVKINGEPFLDYGYAPIRAELDDFHNKKGTDKFYNFTLDLSSITDATGRTYQFEYGGGLGLYSYSSDVGYYVSSPIWAVSKVILPSENGEESKFALFGCDTDIKLSLGADVLKGQGRSILRNGVGKRSTSVVDADGNLVRYTWLDTSASETADCIESMIIVDYDASGLSNDFADPIAVFYPRLQIDHFSGSGESAELIGSEVFEFDSQAGMALSKIKDFCGNTAEYSHSDELENTGRYSFKHSDPNSEIRKDSNGNIVQKKEFTYSQHYRIMDSLKEYGAGENVLRKTVWEVDEFGRRTSEKLYASEDENPVKETQFAYDDTFKNFLAETLIKDGAGAGKDMLTRNIPDENGRIAQTIKDPEGLALATSFEYNQNGRKILETDPNGNSTAFEYDSFNRLVKVINPDTTERTIEYDAAGRKIKTVNENGVETSYTYNANGLQNSQRIKMSENPSDDIITQTSYSSCGKILSTTDANGNITAFEYDGMGRVLKMTKYEGDATAEKKYITNYAYTGNCGSGVFSTDNFKPSAITDPRGNVSTFTHDALYRETSITLPFGSTGSTTAYEYDTFGNKIKETDALGNITNFEYDAQNKLIKTTFADGTVKSATYSTAGLVLSETDELGNIISHEYDLAGRRIKTVYPSVFDGISNTIKMPTEEFFYDNNGNLAGRKDPTGCLWNTVYDSRNRKIAEVAPAVKRSDNTYARPMSKIVYDNLGNPISTIDANGNQTDTEFDSANRAIKITFPAVQVEQGSTLQRPVETKSYDKNGNVISSVNPRGIITNTEYNSFNKPVKITKNAGDAEANQIIEELSYDGNGNLEVITDGNGNKTKYVYDAMNRRTSAIYGYESETTRTDTWVYDALNMTNRKGVAITYDARNRILTENSRTYAYDPAGRILSVSGYPNANVSYSYDALGRILSETNGGRTHNYAYDLSSHRVKSDYGLSPTQLTPTHSLSYKYDSNGRLVSITDQQNRTTSYSYDLNGNVLKKTNPNGYVLTNTYDALNRVRTKDTMDLKYTYYYDIGGNIIRFYEWNKQGINGMYSWDALLSYDAFDRLISETLYDTNTIYTTTYTYDKNNNRLAKHLQKGLDSDANKFEETYSYTVNALNQVIGIEKRHWLMSSPNDVEVSNTVINYDSRGNAIEIIEGASRTELNYDDFDMPAILSRSTNKLQESYAINFYDYRGRRIQRNYTDFKNQTDYNKYYTYTDGTSVLETKLDVNNTTEKRTLFYRGSDQGGGVGGINYSEFANGEDLNYKFYNLRGDVVMTIDSNNVRKNKYLYFGFGKNELEQGSEIETDKHRANTKVEDENNFLNEGKRFRHLELDVFLTPDPLEYVDGFNPYIYCNQNPWGKWDPEGLAYVISNELSDEDSKYAENIISKVASSSYGKDKSSVFYKIANDANIKVNVSVENTPFGVNGNGNRFDEGSNTIIINKNDIESNSAYVLDSGNGKAELSTVSPESMFVHESTHALDAAQGKDLKKTHNSEYGNNILETDSRAVAEGNKYRESVGEKKRLAYDSYDYDKNNPGKIKNPEEFRKTEKVIKDNNDAHLSKMYAERQKKIENAKGKKDK